MDTCFGALGLGELRVRTVNKGPYIAVRISVRTRMSAENIWTCYILWPCSLAPQLTTSRVSIQILLLQHVPRPEVGPGHYLVKRKSAKSDPHTTIASTPGFMWSWGLNPRLCCILGKHFTYLSPT